ncbi:MAG: RNA methyltransferase [Pseudomonadales bacterium]|nr:RNA methyltransferase [Pseudomonadales bacterium]
MSAVSAGKTRPGKAQRNRLLTIYGRKPVFEALQDDSLSIFRLHLATSNKSAEILDKTVALARQRNIEICYHSRIELSRISKTAKQDQGVALDIVHEGFMDMPAFIEKKAGSPFRLLALDNITNPQNIGMIIRSTAASKTIDGVIIPEAGCAKLDPLVIKASAGTLFKCTIIRCRQLADVINPEMTAGCDICILDGNGKQSVFDYAPAGNAIFVLGNESNGVSAGIRKTASKKLYIPMNNGVESLNVAAAATLVSFYLSIKS